MAKGPVVGDLAPDFALPGTTGEFRLGDHRGEHVVLLFYPGDETLVCTRQFCSYRDRAQDMAALDATIVGISSQDVDRHTAFADHHGLTVPLLADVDRAVARAYGVSRGRLGTQRATFIIGPDGRIAWTKLHTLGLDYLRVDQLRDALATVPAAART